MTARLVSATELARLLGIGRSTFYRLDWWKDRRHRIGGAVRYDVRDVDLYLGLTRLD